MSDHQKFLAGVASAQWVERNFDDLFVEAQRRNMSPAVLIQGMLDDVLDVYKDVDVDPTDEQIPPDGDEELQAEARAEQEARERLAEKGFDNPSQEEIEGEIFPHHALPDELEVEVRRERMNEWNRTFPPSERLHHTREDDELLR